MKIAAIEYFPTSIKGGSEKAFFEVLSELKFLGHDITVFYVKKGDYIIEYERIGIKHQKLPEIEFHYFNFRSYFNLLKSVRVINLSEPNLIYINQLADSVLSCLFKLIYKTPIVCHIRVPKIGNSRLFNFAGKWVDYFICVNHLIKSQYRNYYDEEKLIVVNDGIKIPALETLPQIKPVKTNYATYLGRISPEKGLTQLLDTWQILIDKYNLKIHLDITGPANSENEKNYKTELLQQIKQKKLSHLIKVKDSVSNTEQYFRHYDLSVFPSIWPEPFGRTIPESILAGTPVFARKVGIVNEILSPFNNLFVYEKDEDLAKKIFQFYNLKTDIDLRILQKHIYNHYDIDKNIYLIEDVLKKTLKSK